MNYLKAFVEHRNAMNTIFKQPLLNLDLAKDRQSIADMIDSGLSPENLSCDGELSKAQVNRKYRELTGAAKELQALDPSVKFYEEF
jgi:hypothetical protein